MATLDSVIIGAGQAGLGISYFLQRDDRKHVVFERGRIGESWLSQRWDSFKLNTPNCMNGLPGLPYDGPEPDGFWRRDELVRYFQCYVERFQLPVRTGAAVVSVEQAEDDGCFVVKTRTAGQAEESTLSRSIVIASGIQHTPKYPSIRSRMPDGMTQLHTAGYRTCSGIAARRDRGGRKRPIGVPDCRGSAVRWPDRVSVYKQSRACTPALPGTGSAGVVDRYEASRRDIRQSGG